MTKSIGTMPDYVYALHDFQPENEDEVDFRAGEPIEVIEKDDQYSDGWWQVGTTGFFHLAHGLHVGMHNFAAQFQPT